VPRRRSARPHDGRHLWRVRLCPKRSRASSVYDDEAAKGLGLAAVLHDIRRSGCRMRYFERALLDEGEWIVMKQHTVWGASSCVGVPASSSLPRSPMRIMSDGRHGISAWSLRTRHPAGATIVAVADSFDAMTTTALTASHSIDWRCRRFAAVLERSFNPTVVEALMRVA